MSSMPASDTVKTPSLKLNTSSTWTQGHMSIRLRTVVTLGTVPYSTKPRMLRLSPPFSSPTVTATSSSFIFPSVQCVTNLKRNVPGQVDHVFVFVHPDFSHPQSVPPQGNRWVHGIGLVGSLQVPDPGAG